MEEFGVLTKVEMESRYEVEMEHYSKIINIEALTMLEMARKQLLPAVNAYMSEVANTAASKLAVSEAHQRAQRDQDPDQAVRRCRRHERRHRRPAGCRGCRRGSDQREREGCGLPRQRAARQWMLCVPLPTMPRPSAARTTGLCPATARCSTTSDLPAHLHKASLGCRNFIRHSPFPISYTSLKTCSLLRAGL